MISRGSSRVVTRITSSFSATRSATKSARNLPIFTIFTAGGECPGSRATAQAPHTRACGRGYAMGAESPLPPETPGPALALEARMRPRDLTLVVVAHRVHPCPYVR